ncbi:unnamed protein product, partial [Rotaria sp. Silwood2]
QLKEIDPPYPLLEPVPVPSSIRSVQKNANVEFPATGKETQSVTSGEPSTTSSKVSTIPKTSSGNNSL